MRPPALSPAHPTPGLLIGTGEVLHTRLRPVQHAFRYPTFFLMLPMRHWQANPAQALPRNRFGAVSFHDADHGDGRADSLAWLDELSLSAFQGFFVLDILLNQPVSCLLSVLCRSEVCPPCNT